MTRSWIYFTSRPLCAPSAGRARRAQGRAPQPARVRRSGRDALPTGRIEVVRVEGDYRPRQIDSADVVAANRPTRALGR
jgi:hypothetical protein